MNCTVFDAALRDSYAAIAHGGNDVWFGVLLAASLVASGVLLVFGERLIRTTAALVGGVGGAVAVFALTGTSESFACETRLILSGVSGLVGALLAFCMLRTGLVLLGAAGFGTVAHFVYETLPLSAPAENTASFLGRAWHYYVAVGGAVLLGAVVSYVQRRQLVRVMSALLGGGSLVFGVHLVVERSSDAALHPLAALGILAGATCGGVTAQHVLAGKRRRRRRRKEGFSTSTRRRRRRRVEEEEMEVV